MVYRPIQSRLKDMPREVFDEFIEPIHFVLFIAKLRLAEKVDFWALKWAQAGILPIDAKLNNRPPESPRKI
jgi:hypothetical protein